MIILEKIKQEKCQGGGPFNETCPAPYFHLGVRTVPTYICIIIVFIHLLQAMLSRSCDHFALFYV